MAAPAVPRFSSAASILTPAEQSQASETFHKFDVNQNGTIEFDELLGGLETLKAGHFASKEALRAYVDQMFARADADGSGGIDEAEFLAIYNEIILNTDSMAEVLETPREPHDSESQVAIAGMTEQQLAEASSTVSQEVTEDWLCGCAEEGDPTWEVVIGKCPRFADDDSFERPPCEIGDFDWEVPYSTCGLSGSECTKLVSYHFEQDLMSRDTPAAWDFELYCPLSKAYTAYHYIPGT